MSNNIYILEEHKTWVLVWKPHNIPTAPLFENEKDTLLFWTISKYPEVQNVIGKKPIEHGLIHRLDTGTEGIVLIARTQQAYNFFNQAQQNNLILKQYRALTQYIPNSKIQPPPKLPFTLTSRFKAFGPGRKMVKPLFPTDRDFPSQKKDYTTTILSIQDIIEKKRTIHVIDCSLTQGARHQVRAHLSVLGYPILGDTLYNPLWQSQKYRTEDKDLPLQLCANGISFPNPENDEQVNFLLPLQDKMIL